MVTNTPWAQRFSSVSGPATNIAQITPNDSADIETQTRGIMVNGAGDVKLTTAGGQTVTLTLAASTIYPIAVNRVYATDTTATGIHGVW